MKRWGIFFFGTVSYVLFLAVFLYGVGFIGNFLVPTTLDGEPAGSLAGAVAVNLALVALFGVQHSVMARPSFKHRILRLVPQSAERSVYVLATCAVLGLLYWQWQPVGGTVWNVTDPLGRTVLYGLFAAGWLTVLVTTFLINHFDLFGLRQVWLYFRGRPYTPLRFVTPGPYRFIRHPLYVGWLLAFWATPTMSVSHLVFSLAMAAYILIAIPIEERDLVRFHPDYAEYRREVPMLVPRLLPQRSVETQNAT